LEKDSANSQPIDIPLEQFIDTLQSNSRSVRANVYWLLAVAHAQSGIKNDREETTKRIGPFRFSEDNWKTFVEENPDTGVRIDEIGRWDMQAVIAPRAFVHYHESLKRTLDGAEPTALQLYIAHVLGLSAASAIAKANGTELLADLLQGAGLQQEIIDYGLKLLPPGKIKVSDLIEVLREELQQGIDRANELLQVPGDHAVTHADIKQQLVEGFLAEGRQGLADMVHTREFHVWIQQESSWIPDITSPPNNQGLANDGLFQIWRGHSYNNEGQVAKMSPREQAQLVAKKFELTPEKIRKFCNEIESGTYRGWG
jgi:hypothetical protein